MQPVAPRRAPRQPDADTAVATFLRENPAWLARQPDLYDVLEPPHRVHGERLADHMAAMLAAARARADRFAATAAAAAADRRVGAGFADRVHAAILALLRATDPADCITQAWPGLLGLDAASLCLEADRPGTRRLPPGGVADALGRRVTLVRSGAFDPALPGTAGAALHGEAAPLARTEALVRVPLEACPALLALACRDARAFVGAAASLAFLGAAAAAALERD